MNNTQKMSKLIKAWLPLLLLLCLLIGLSSCCSQHVEEKETMRMALSTNASCQEDCCNSLQARAPLTFYYYQNTGRFKGGSGNSTINTLGYSGQGAGYNNPDYQCKQDGPLPSSTYEVAFCKNMMHQVTNRPCSFYLKPKRPVEVCGRDDFFIHGCQCCTTGDDSEPPAAGCSAGCIVINYRDRKKIRLGDTIIVQSYEPKMEAIEISQQ